MREYALSLLEQHRRTGILLDTNLLLVYVVGQAERTRIPKFKHTRTYTIEDYEQLAALLGQVGVGKVHVTPHILTEVSNFLGHLAEPLKGYCLTLLAQALLPMKDAPARLKELILPSDQVAQMEEWGRFGITDAAMMALAQQHNLLVVTDDFRLAQYLAHHGVATLNFNHIRPLNSL